MADRGIIFSAPMVRALLAGTKTQTRRLITPRNQAARLLFFDDWTDEYVLGDGNAEWRQAAHGYSVGDRLYVRESYRLDLKFDAHKPRDVPPGQWVSWEADHLSRLLGKLRPAIFMPRWASRLTLTMTDVRVQRLQAIDEADAISEGVEPAHIGTQFTGPWRDYGPEPLTFTTARESYKSLWNSLHDTDGQRWGDNPWVVALTFEVGRHNIDAGAVR